MEPTRGITGYLEVLVNDNLVHSKKVSCTFILYAVDFLKDLFLTLERRRLYRYGREI